MMFGVGALLQPSKADNPVLDRELRLRRCSRWRWLLRAWMLLFLILGSAGAVWVGLLAGALAFVARFGYGAYFAIDISGLYMGTQWVCVAPMLRAALCILALPFAGWVAFRSMLFLWRRPALAVLAWIPPAATAAWFCLVAPGAAAHWLLVPKRPRQGWSFDLPLEIERRVTNAQVTEAVIVLLVFAALAALSWRRAWLRFRGEATG